LDEEKVKTVFAVFQLKNRSDVREILSYLDQSSYGWQGHTYQFYNRHLQYGGSLICRHNSCIDNNADSTAQALDDIKKIFLIRNMEL